MKKRKIAAEIAVHIFLIALSVIWLLPFFWLILQSFRLEPGQFTETFFPKNYTVANYVRLFTDTNVINFGRMFMNTLIIAVFTCILSTFFVLSVSYCMSRLKFKLRRTYMNTALILNLFPGFMSMIAVYFILKALNLTEGSMIPVSLVLVFSAGAGTQFYVMKGYMDTIPKSLDEAASLDGCTKWQIFTKITIPLCKPMIVYQVITSFMTPFVDFIFARIIVRAESKYFTVSLGLWNMLEKEYVYSFYTRFCAGAVLVSVPVAILFIVTQRYYREAMSGAVKG